MPNTEGQDLLALQKAIHSSNHQSSRQKDWHPEKMTEIQPHVSGIINSLYINITDVSWQLFLWWIEELHLTFLPNFLIPRAVDVKDRVPAVLHNSSEMWTWMTRKREAKCPVSVFEPLEILVKFLYYRQAVFQCRSMVAMQCW